MQRFFECDHNVRFDIASAFCRRLTPTESAKSGPATSATEKCLEEIAEPGSAKLELNPAVVAGAIESSSRLLPSPSGRRLKSPGLVPTRAELIVLLAFLRIAQHLVRFVDLLELFLGGLLILRHVGMMFSRQFAKGGANFIIARRLRDAQRLIIISKLHRHGSNLFACIAPRNSRAGGRGRMRLVGRRSAEP